MPRLNMHFRNVSLPAASMAIGLGVFLSLGGTALALPTSPGAVEDGNDAVVSRLQTFQSASAPTGEFENIVSGPRIVVEGRVGADEFTREMLRVVPGDLEATLRATERVLAAKPNSGLAYEVAGTTQLLLGRDDLAMAAFEKAVELEPENGDAWSKLGTVYLKLGQVDQAQQALERAVALNDADRFAHQKLGIIADQKGDRQAAIHHYRMGLRGAPANYLGVAVDLAALLNTRGTYPAAIEVLEPRLPLDASNDFAQQTLGVAYLGAGRPADAVARFERALALNEASYPAWLGMAAALRMSCKYAQALQQLQRIDKRFPGAADTAIERARVFFAMNRVKDAMQAYADAERLGGDANLIARLRSETLVAANDNKGAEAALLKVVQAGNADPEIYARVSELRLAEGDATGGEAILRQGVERHPSSAYMHFRLGSFLAATRRYADAQKEFERSLALSPDDIVVLRALSLVQLRAGDPAAAAATAESLYKVTGYQAVAGMHFAQMLQAAGQAEKATAVYRDVVRSSPDAVAALNNLANLLVDQGDIAGAEEFAVRAARLAPGNGHVLDTLGWVYYKAGRYPEALEALDRSIGLKESLAAAHFHRALVLNAVGRQSEASQAAKRALSLQPQAEWASEARGLVR